ncbi:hypothetical protein EXIGLDRAFT_424417 [Exidia glandulosa HHB12029]|uniref:Uncharacterized protein n=1 Tax=Exidia glandulosa HHB12029 TaxID=1314781 RepID=A0A165KKH5_EXIGL|nr:hypothetical protein EXIGLDRAFT_424417 [Exidia glandulosa HHB12029]
MAGATCSVLHSASCGRLPTRPQARLSELAYFPHSPVGSCIYCGTMARVCPPLMPVLPIIIRLLHHWPLLPRTVARTLPPRDLPSAFDPCVEAGPSASFRSSSQRSRVAQLPSRTSSTGSMNRPLWTRFTVALDFCSCFSLWIMPKASARRVVDIELLLWDPMPARRAITALATSAASRTRKRSTRGATARRVAKRHASHPSHDSQIRACGARAQGRPTRNVAGSSGFARPVRFVGIPTGAGRFGATAATGETPYHHQEGLVPGVQVL